MTEPDITSDVTLPSSPQTSPEQQVSPSIAGSTWVALIVGILTLIVLLIFILQNLHPAELHIFAWSFTMPTGIGVLFGAILGALIMALVGGVRMLQLRRQVKR